MAKRRSSTPGGRSEPTRTLLSALVIGAAVVLVLLGLRFVPGSPLAAASPRWLAPGVTPAGTPTGAPPTPPAPTEVTPTPGPPDALAVRAAPVQVEAQGWWSWALLDRRTGEITGSANMAGTSTTASLIKAWIGADFLRRSAEAGEEPSETRLAQVRVMIRDSDNDAAQALWRVVGQSAAIRRMIRMCGMTDSSAYRNLWSNTRLSPRDVTRLAVCIADGRAAGPQWTEWLVKEMRAVRGVGDFGIRKAFPKAAQKQIAIKNGWVTRDAAGEWHVNCLAVAEGWAMGVMTRYPAQLGYQYGAKICRDVARQLRAT